MENSMMTETLERVKNIETLLTSTKNVLNLDEVCSYTGLSKSHIYKLTCSGRVPHFKQAKHLYFDRAEVEVWLKENRVKTQAEVDREATALNIKRKGGRK